MNAMSRNLASALAVSTACGAIASAVFSLALAVLPHPQFVVQALLHRPSAPTVRVESTVADAAPAVAGS